MPGPGNIASTPGASLIAAAVMLRRGEPVLLRAEGRETVRLRPTPHGAEVTAGDVVLARTGLLPDGPGRVVLEEVTGARADVVRLDESGWVLLENIFGKVVSDG